MSQIKTCTKREDLVCGNCIYSVAKTPHVACKYALPENLGLMEIVVHPKDTCGAGQWYCELKRSWEDPGHYPTTWHRVCSKTVAVTSFMDADREGDTDNLQPVDKDGEAACAYLFKRLKNAANNNYFGRCNDGILKLSALNNVGIVCNSVFLTDKGIEFTVRADVEFK